MPTLARALAGLTCGVVVAAVVALGAATAPAAALQRGIVEHRLESFYGVDRNEIPALTREMGRKGLRAKWARLLVHWAKLQPLAPGTSSPDDLDGDGYVDSYVEELHAVADSMRAQGMKVIMTVTEVPRWASDERLWNDPPRSDIPKGYSPIYALDAGNPAVLAQFRALGTFLAGDFKTAVRYFECWNEPNLGGSFYPQSRPGDRWFGLRVYVKMLRVFHSGVRKASKRAVVIAGASAPRGANDHFSTMPATFAKYLRNHRAGRYFEGYSCHVYSWGPPGLPPWQPRSAVTLGNLESLIKYFPRKSFYVTEFGYSTVNPSLLGEVVSEATQARYLRQAYSQTARRYKQVKTILWFMVKDIQSIHGGAGISMGLRRIDGTRKPGWFAFRGGNRMTLRAPSRVRRAVAFRLSGTLTTPIPKAASGLSVTLQSRRRGEPTWQPLSTHATRPNGSYAFRARQERGVCYYRVVWDGVCGSNKATVRSR